MRIKQRLVWSVLLTLVCLTGAVQSQTILTVDEAAQRIDEEVTFEGKVMGVASSSYLQATYLSFGGAYPFQKLSVLFAGDHVNILFGQLPDLMDRTVRITGVVKKGKKSPVVRVTDVKQVEVLPAKDRVSLDSTGDSPAFRKQMRSMLFDLFRSGDYATLDAAAAQWRTDKDRFLDGRWKLATFYIAFSNPTMPFPEYFKKLEEWQAAYPDSITPKLLHADAMIRYAWDARGAGWASTVTEEAWKLYRERLALARAELMEVEARSKECPQWFAIMQTVALGQSWDRDQVDTLFKTAIQNNPEYGGVYSDRMITYLQPKWYGKEDEWVDFSNSLLDLLPPGLGEETYARIAMGYRTWTDQILLQKEGRYFPDMGFRWEPMKAGFERLRARYPQSPRIVNEYALFAGKASDWETANRLLLELGDDCDMDIWITWQNVALARSWAGGKGLPGTYFILFR